MTEFFGIPPATYAELDAAHTAAERARQLDEATYAQALVDPEACERYRHDLGFRMEIDLWRQAMHTADRIMAEEGISPQQRDRVLRGMTFAREPYRGVEIQLGAAERITLPHGPFGITVGNSAIVDGQLRHSTTVVSCACGQARAWARGVTGGELLAWLRDHPEQNAAQAPFRWPDTPTWFSTPKEGPAGG